MAGCDAEFFFEPRFCGPPGTVNGGFACGALAELCGGTAEATLHRAPDDGLRILPGPARPRPGQECRVLARPLARDGRKLPAGSALLDPDGAVLATARTLWITVPRPALGRTVGAAS